MRKLRLRVFFARGIQPGAAFIMRVDEFPQMPDWFPDFVRELAALSPAERRELDAWLAEREARAEAVRVAQEAAKQERQRRLTLARLVAKAKRLGMDVTVEPNGAATFRTGSSTTTAADENPQTEVDEWIAKHAN
jgi:hypothetical protein